MHALRRMWFAAAAAGGLGLGAPAAAQNVPPVVTFDTVWTIINRVHFDSTFGGVDWNRVRAELRPKAERARNDTELRAVLQAMVQRLGQSHYSIMPREATEEKRTSEWQGDLGFDARFLDGAVVVTSVDAGGPAVRAGIKPGWILQRIGKTGIGSVLKRADALPRHYAYNARVAIALRGELAGAEGSAVQLQFRNERDRNVTVALTRGAPVGEPIKLMQLPTMYTRFRSRTADVDGQPVGIAWFNVWMLPMVAAFDSAVDRFRSAAGLVIDLRGNPGGAGAISMGVAGHLLDTAQAFGTMNTRTSKMQFRANPRRVSTTGQRVTPFGGPVAVLIDELSGSTSEVFAGGLQSIGRVRVFGTRSMGAVLPALTTTLPNGDVLYHAFADFVTADGTLLEGRGVIPDEQVVVKRADLLAGRDPVLEAALRWIARQARARKSLSSIPEMKQWTPRH